MTKIEAMQKAIEAVTEHFEAKDEAIADLVTAAKAAMAALKAAEDKLDDLASDMEDGEELTKISLATYHAAIDLEGAIETIENLK